MSFTPPVFGSLPPVYLSTFHVDSCGRYNHTSGPSGAAWSATNRIVYVPFVLSHSSTVYRLFWLNGGTVSGAVNVQAGVYDQNMTRVIAGTSTAGGTANVCQYDNITDTGLAPGRYYMALWLNGTGHHIFRAVSIGHAADGIYYETNAGGLPTTATPVGPATTTPVLPVMGLALRATP